MRYELLEEGKNNYFLDIEQTIVKNRGLSNLDILKNVSIKDTHHYSLLNNIDKATECLINHLKKGSKIHIIGDDDLDGSCSFAIIYNYLKEIYDEEKLSWNVHNEEGRVHGIKLKELDLDQFDLLIVPDGTSSDYKEYKILKEKGKDVILLDHHEAEYESEDAIVVNNHLCDYPNKQLSGAGIVYKLCQSLDDSLNLKLADNFLDLVAVAQIGDMMLSTELETQYYIQEGLKNIVNPFLKALIDKQSFSLKRVNMNGIAFYIAPLINAVTRIGTYEEKYNTFKAFIDNKTMVLYKKRGAKVAESVFLYQDMARQCVNIKSRQDRQKKKYVAEFIDKVHEEDPIIIIKTEKDFIKGFSGLMANDLANKFNRPCLVLKEREKDGIVKLSGSGRGYEHSPIKDLRNFLLESNLCENADGHGNAFGITIKQDNIINLLKHTKDSLKTNSTETLYMVDFIIPQEKFKLDIIRDISKLEDFYGQGFKEPYITIKDYILNTKDIKMNEKGTRVAWKERGIEFINFSNAIKIYSELTQYPQVKLDLVGKAKISEWKGITNYQFVINDYNILSTNEIEQLKKKIAPSWF